MSDPRIEQAVLEDGDMRACVLSYGAITQGLWYKGVPMILGHEDPQQYLSDKNYLGAIVGRVANRIAGASFELGDTRFALDANEGQNTLHSGRAGLSHQHWELSQISAGKVVLHLNSPDGDSGFPGHVRFEVQVRLEYPRLVYSILAEPDRPTPISIAQHNYYTIGGAAGISEHKLRLASDRYLQVDEQKTAFGSIIQTANGAMDFADSKAISGAGDIDHFFVFQDDRDHERPVAEVTAPNGLKLRVWSDQPGAQIYTGAHLSDPFPKCAGLCIEPSGYPNAPNVASFPSIVCSPELPYRQTLILEIGEGET